MLLVEFQGQRPQIADNVFIAPNATLVGNVIIEEGASVWFGAVLRGDSGTIRIGSGVSVQDNVVIHVNNREDTIIEANVTIGHAAVLEGCLVGRGALIGMNATVLSGSKIGEGAIVAAGAVVLEGATIPERTIAAGVPAKVSGEVTAAALERLARAPKNYRKYAALYRETAVYEETHDA